MDPISPNDPTAEAYDVVYGGYIGPERTEKEIRFLKGQFPANGKVLDVGCGTGRHAIPLLAAGFELTCLDESSGMLDVLKRKLPSRGPRARIILGNILDQTFDAEFDGVICFWNTIAEIGTSQWAVSTLFEVVARSLKEAGRFILDQDNPSAFGAGDFKFTSVSDRDGRTYETAFEECEFDERTNVLKAREVVKITENGREIQTLRTEFRRRWWTKAELADLCEKAGFSRVEFYDGAFADLLEASERIIMVATR
jgi:SAM-dependent methyltransferase